jgi:hypothetical protein
MAYLPEGLTPGHVAAVCIVVFSVLGTLASMWACDW